MEKLNHRRNVLVKETLSAPPSGAQAAAELEEEVSQVASKVQGNRSNRMASVLCYVPNLIGYLRLVLLIVAWFFYENIFVFLPVYALSALLDCIDGYVARRLKQTSAFGAWLDVLADNIGRSIIWGRLNFSWGVLIICLEWTVFVCMHTAGHSWKSSFGSAPWWVKSVMDNGFYSLVGAFTICGIHVLPPYVYFYTNYKTAEITFLDHFEVLLIVPLVILGAGRLLCLAVELWCIKEHILHLVHLEEDNQVKSITRDLDKRESP